MKRVIMLFAASQFCFSALAEDSLQSPRVTLSSPKTFFDYCQETLIKPERGEFETLEEYSRRTTVTLDTTRIWFLNLAQDDLPLVKPYSYDIESEELCFVGGGKCPAFELFNREKPKGLLIVVHTQFEDRGHYTASNALGASIEVEETWVHKYGVDIINRASLPQVYLNDEAISVFGGALTACIRRSPKDAEQLSKKARLAIGVRLRTDSQHNLECTSSVKPTFSNPRDYAEFVQWVNVDFAKLLIVNTETGEVLASVEATR